MTHFYSFGSILLRKADATRRPVELLNICKSKKKQTTRKLFSASLHGGKSGEEGEKMKTRTSHLAVIERPPRASVVLTIFNVDPLQFHPFANIASQSAFSFIGGGSKRLGKDTNSGAGAWKRMLRAWVTPTPFLPRRTPSATSGTLPQLVHTETYGQYAASSLIHTKIGY